MPRSELEAHSPSANGAQEKSETAIRHGTHLSFFPILLAGDMGFVTVWVWVPGNMAGEIHPTDTSYSLSGNHTKQAA